MSDKRHITPDYFEIKVDGETYIVYQNETIEDVLATDGIDRTAKWVMLACSCSECDKERAK
jgi:hypothetical protein